MLLNLACIDLLNAKDLDFIIITGFSICLLWQQNKYGLCHDAQKKKFPNKF